MVSDQAILRFAILLCSTGVIGTVNLLGVPLALEADPGTIVKLSRGVEVKMTGVKFDPDGTHVGLEIDYKGGYRADFDWTDQVILADGIPHKATGADGMYRLIYEGYPTAGQVSFPTVGEKPFTLKVSVGLPHNPYPLEIYTFEIDPLLHG